MNTLKEMSQKIGDLFLVCRQMRYLADAAGDPEAVKAWDATGNHLAEALLAADRAGPCAVCDRRTDVRCKTCDALLCTQLCADRHHAYEAYRLREPAADGLWYTIAIRDNAPCHLPERPKVPGGPCVVCAERTDARCQRCDVLLCTEEHALMYHTSTDTGRECDWRRVLTTSYPEFHPPLGATFPEPTMPTYLGPKRGA